MNITASPSVNKTKPEDEEEEEVDPVIIGLAVAAGFIVLALIATCIIVVCAVVILRYSRYCVFHHWFSFNIITTSISHT